MSHVVGQGSSVSGEVEWLVPAYHAAAGEKKKKKNTLSQWLPLCTCHFCHETLSSSLLSVSDANLMLILKVNAVDRTWQFLIPQGAVLGHTDFPDNLKPKWLKEHYIFKIKINLLDFILLSLNDRFFLNDTN